MMKYNETYLMAGLMIVMLMVFSFFFIAGWEQFTSEISDMMNAIKGVVPK